MDIKDLDSPLRGLLNSPIKRITPAVPVPDWLNSPPGRPIPLPVSKIILSYQSSQSFIITF